MVSIKENEILFVRQGNVTSLREVSPDAAGYMILFEDQTLNQLFSKSDILLTSFTISLNLLIPIASY
ncbi:hypothetical protein QW060_08175 [Myroides ceti]|uniref:Uncharacterized protein n=1 Tax=Paenimyroides ceti TaxID=395087 RepID=A0ABT8CVA6_9FLAO|nr:hypothetical protein [Paenimyroides ceti]MDN3707110.1 hypothetical protein [Paenimyroides ceti]